MMLRSGSSATAASKSPSSGANIMTPGERKLMTHIIGEREERVKAISDLTSQLQGLQRELRDAKASLARMPAAAPSQESKSNVPSSDLKAEIESQRKELEAQRLAFETQTTQFTKSLEDLRSAHQKADLECHESLRKSMNMGSQLRKDLDELQTKAGPLSGGKAKAQGEQPANGKAKPQGEQPVSDEGQVNSVPATSSWLSKEEEAKKLLDGKFDPEGFRALVRHTKGLEDQFSQQAKEVVSIRTVLIEVHVNLLLHAMRASRIALRSTELSREERRLALTSLDVKEKQIREDVDALRVKIETCPVVALAEIAKVTLEQTF